MCRPLKVLAGVLAGLSLLAHLAGCPRPSDSAAQIVEVHNVGEISNPAEALVPSSDVRFSDSARSLLDSEQRRNRPGLQESQLSEARSSDGYQNGLQSLREKLASIAGTLGETNFPLQLLSSMRSALNKMARLHASSSAGTASLQDHEAATLLPLIVSDFKESLGSGKPMATQTNIQYNINALVFKALTLLERSGIYPPQAISSIVLTDEKLLLCLSGWVCASIPELLIPYRHLERVVFEAEPVGGLFSSPDSQTKRKLIFAVLAQLFRRHGSVTQNIYRLKMILLGAKHLPGELANERSELVLQVVHMLSDVLDESSQPVHLMLPNELDSMFAYHVLSYILTHSSEPLRVNTNQVVVTPTLRIQLEFRNLLLEMVDHGKILLTQLQSIKTELRTLRQNAVRLGCVGPPPKKQKQNWEEFFEQSLEQELKILGFKSYQEYYQFFKDKVAQWRQWPQTTDRVPLPIVLAKQWSEYRARALPHTDLPSLQSGMGCHQVGIFISRILGENRILSRLRKFFKSSASTNAPTVPLSLRSMIGMNQDEDHQNSEKWVNFLDLMEWRLASFSYFNEENTRDQLFWWGLPSAPVFSATLEELGKFGRQIENLANAHNFMNPNPNIRSPLGGNTNNALWSLLNGPEGYMKFMPPEETSSHTISP